MYRSEKEEKEHRLLHKAQSYARAQKQSFVSGIVPNDCAKFLVEIAFFLGYEGLKSETRKKNLPFEVAEVVMFLRFTFWTEISDNPAKCS